MTYQELAAQIVQLPIQERLSLLELLSRSLRDDFRLHPSGTSLATRLRGIARTDKPVPADEELTADYIYVRSPTALPILLIDINADRLSVHMKHRMWHVTRPGISKKSGSHDGRKSTVSPPLRRTH